MRTEESKIAERSNLRVRFRGKFRVCEIEASRVQRITTEGWVGGGDGQKVGATPVLDCLRSPELHSAAFGASGVAPTFCPAP